MAIKLPNTLELGFSWTCPYCNRATTITPSNNSIGYHFFDGQNVSGHLGLVTKVIICPNSLCKEYSITGSLYSALTIGAPGRPSRDTIDHTDKRMEWRLKPRSLAKQYSPDIVPQVIIDDYEEACLIRDLSPKASATLSRRCLQGMIRDFHGIVKGRLIDEIYAIENIVDASTWDAIDAVRKVGNIGAHMEKDISVIVDVEPNEAQLLIELIEILINDWYINRHQRSQHLQKIKQMAVDKNKQKSTKKKIS